MTLLPPLVFLTGCDSREDRRAEQVPADRQAAGAPMPFLVARCQPGTVWHSREPWMKPPSRPLQALRPSKRTRMRSGTRPTHCSRSSARRSAGKPTVHRRPSPNSSAPSETPSRSSFSYSPAPTISLRAHDAIRATLTEHRASTAATAQQLVGELQTMTNVAERPSRTLSGLRQIHSSAERDGLHGSATAVRGVLNQVGL